MFHCTKTVGSLSLILLSNRLHSRAAHGLTGLLFGQEIRLFSFTLTSVLRELRQNLYRLYRENKASNEGREVAIIAVLADGKLGG